MNTTARVSRRLASCASLRSAAARTSRTVAAQRWTSTHSLTPRPRATLLQSQNAYPMVTRVRYESTEAPPAGNTFYNYEQVRDAISKSKDEKTPVIIDVREPAEYEAGYVPTAINIPVKSQPDALFLPTEEFEERFGFAKPSEDVEVLFYCRSGVRSRAAAHFARQQGYTRVAEYPGSWLDWEAKGGESGKMTGRH